MIKIVFKVKQQTINAKLLAIPVIFVFAITCTSFRCLYKKEKKTKWNLVWQDEFNYDGLPDTTKWSYDVGGTGWGNNELQYYTNRRQQNVLVSDGVLQIKAIKEKFEGKDYTSTRLVTRGKQDFKYGKIEIRAKLPKGRGVWPAVWMLSSKQKRVWPDDGEIDIMEYVGYAPNEITGAAHVKKNKTGTEIYSSIKEIMITEASEAFHIYTLNWTPEKLEWFVDNKLFHSYKKANKPAWQWPFDGRFYIIANVAIGGSWGGRKGVDNSIFPQSLTIDYIRVYSPNQ